MRQTLLFSGIYEFEDPSGSLLAARVPAHGSIDLYNGTTVHVRPNQCAIFVYKGTIADVLGPGLHEIKTENVPILTRLANWKKGFRSPLRCDLWFFSGQLFSARRWGTNFPVIVPLSNAQLPIRAFGQYNVRVRNPKALLLKLLGSRSAFGVADLEEWIQGHILEQLPAALADVKELAQLSQKQQEVASRLQAAVQENVVAYGVTVESIQVMSLLPTKDILKAMDDKAAMQLIGDKKEYLLYKAANSLDALHSSSKNDPLQMMMGLMLGKQVMGADREPRVLPKQNETAAEYKCAHCQSKTTSAFRFCPQCGKEAK